MRAQYFSRAKRLWPILILLAVLLGSAVLPQHSALAGQGLDLAAGAAPCSDHTEDGTQACPAQGGCLSPLLLAHPGEAAALSGRAFSLPGAQTSPARLDLAPPKQPPKLLWIL